MKNIYFTGIGGSGMSSLACISKAKGHNVAGSDRNNTEPLPKILKHLKSQDINLFPQDGSGINETTDTVVISTAIEDDNPDLIKARSLKTNVIHRSKMLADFFNEATGIAVGGTNGKTTVSGMISFILTELKKDPSFILGGEINNYRNTGLSSYRAGQSDLMVIEADESDGSLVNYHSSLAIINNISRDHKEIDELLVIFNQFAENTKDKILINADCKHCDKIEKSQNMISFGIENKADYNAAEIKLSPLKSNFSIDNTSFEIQAPGIHNVYNALAASATLNTLGISMDEISNTLKNFKGMHRRFEIIRQDNDFTVIDDFGHNPVKIEATLKTVTSVGKRLIAFFQPHGFGPTKFMRDDYISIFSKYLNKNDFLYMPEIFYRGGTASKDISSADLIKKISKNIPNSYFIPSRDEIKASISKNLKKGDTILIMGARDNTLTTFCQEIADMLPK